jgi:hypothetical protein
LSNAIHLAADTGRVITCPFIPGRLPDAAMAMVIAVEQPEGTLLPKLVQWLPSAALDEPIGTIGGAALHETMAIVTASWLSPGPDSPANSHLLNRHHYQLTPIAGRHQYVTVTNNAVVQSLSPYRRLGRAAQTSATF